MCRGSADGVAEHTTVWDPAESKPTTRSPSPGAERPPLALLPVEADHGAIEVPNVNL